jgi:hypothetical protein
MYGSFNSAFMLNVGFMRSCLDVILLYVKDWDIYIYIYIPEDNALALKHVLTYLLHGAKSLKS